ncbi:vegetative incompatibility protein HET-E-1 [Aspergillus lentulus]|uniref:Vegetative incompatibility protein HET-E-1 n=1 Tax=Aspergillus lentulus TaxID=293939 RepID=A0AAN4PPN8_ASPLE|nr:vegetative incompatibility protein HET-E-1 [Aspergillus lentulus]
MTSRSSSSFFSRLKHKGSKKRGDPSGEAPPANAKTTAHKNIDDLLQNAGPGAVPTAPSSGSKEMIHHIAERLWNAAYDGLKVEEKELVDAYERILSRELGNPSSGDAESNKIEQSDPQKRQLQMEQLIRVAMQGVLALNNVIGAALQPVPQAALAWVGVSFALQILVNPTTETTANREGISYVAARMAWYCELSELLLGENTVDGGSSAGLRSKLEGQLIDLYKLLLSYLMKSVCSLYRNRVINYLQDMIKLNDWDGNLKAIQTAEKIVQQDSADYNTQQIKSHLEQLVSFAQNQETELLSNLGQALQNQTKLQKEMKDKEEDNRLLKDLCLTDPRDDIARIEQTKGRLLEGSCAWILERQDFIDWRDGDGSGLYWIKGGPGKGKTMLLIGITQDMLRTAQDTGLVSFFLCQNTDPKLNTATSILRGLVYQLALQERALIQYIRSDYDSRGRLLFEDSNAFFALSRILSRILNHPNLPKVYFIIDALDECQTDLQPLLKLITEHALSSRLRCLVSSRPRDEIRSLLGVSGCCAELDLDENALENVKTVVKAYIDYKITELTQRKRYSAELQQEVKDYLQIHADGTFLWVALVCQQLQKTFLWKTLSVLKSFPSGLEPLYQRMMGEMHQLKKESPDTFDYCQRILGSITLALRPLHLTELGLLAGLEPELAEDQASLEEIVGLCGNFLVVRKGMIYFVHQSAKDYLTTHGYKEVFPNGDAVIHSGIVSRALEDMSNTLCRDIWNLHDPGCAVEEIEAPVPDPLRYVRYACTYWIDHLCELDSYTQQSLGLCDNGAVSAFFQKHLLHWLEALSLLRSITSAVEVLAKLEQSLTEIPRDSAQLLSIVTDAKHFVDYHQYVIGNAPLQLYISALVLSPSSSKVKALFEDQAPSWIKNAPLMDSDWKLHVHILNGVKAMPISVAFSPDGQLVASGSSDTTIQIWNAKTKAVQRVLDSHIELVFSLAFSRDGTLLASGSTKTIFVWSHHTGQVIKTLEGHGDLVHSVAFSRDDKMLISGSHDNSVRIWDVQTGKLLRILEGHTAAVRCVVVSAHSQVASCGDDGTIRTWDANTGALRHILTPDLEIIRSISFSPDGKFVAAAAGATLQIWDVDHGQLQEIFQRDSIRASSVDFSPTGQRLAVGFRDGIVQIWNVEAGSWSLLQTLEAGEWVRSVAFSGDGRRLAIASQVTVRIWDTEIKVSQGTLAAHTLPIRPITASPCGKWLATGIWDTQTGDIIHVFTGHSDHVQASVFSPDGRRVASGSKDNTTRIWDPYTGVLERTIETYWPYAVAWSQNGLLLASGSCAAGVRIWNAETGELQGEIQGEPDRNGICVSVAFSHDGRYLACGFVHGSSEIMIYNVETGVLQDAILFKLVPSGLSFSEDGSNLFTNFGSIAIALNSTPAQAPKANANDGMELTAPQHREAEWVGYGLDFDISWITWNGRRLLRLPLEYRGRPHLVQDRLIALAHGLGRVIIFEFADGISPL